MRGVIIITPMRKMGLKYIKSFAQIIQLIGGEADVRTQAFLKCKDPILKMLPDAVETTAIRNGAKDQGWCWIKGELGMQRAAKQVSSGWHWCWGFCCHPGTDQLDLGESQEASDK